MQPKRVPALTVLRWVRRVSVSLAGFAVALLATLYITALSEEQKWFEHPSAQAAAIMRLAGEILASPWLHWGTGSVIGFSVGIWLDEFLRKLSIRAVVKSEPKGAKGFLDYQLEFHASNNAIGKILGKASRWMAWISREIASQTKNLQRIARDSHGDMHARTVRAHRLARRASGTFYKFNKGMAQIRGEFAEVIGTLIPSMEWQFQTFSAEDKVPAAAGLIQLGSSCTAAKQHVLGFASALPRGVSSELNAAVEATTTLMMEYVSDLDALIQSFAKLVGESLAA